MHNFTLPLLLFLLKCAIVGRSSFPYSTQVEANGFFAEVASGKMSSKVAVLYVTLISDHCQQGVSHQVDCHKRLVKKKKSPIHLHNDAVL